MQKDAASASHRTDIEFDHAPRDTQPSVGSPVSVILFYRTKNEGTVL